VTALGIKLSSEDLVRGARRPTEDIDAYGDYLKARNILRGHRDAKTIESAIDLFNQAVVKDAGFALAYTGLCDADLFMYDLTKDAVWPEKALGAAYQAEHLNPNLPEVHIALGAAFKATGKTGEAIAELRRALELAPNSDEGYRRLASTYMDVGETQKALEMYAKANEINPYYWGNHNQLGAAYMKLAYYDKAADEFRRVTQLEQDLATGYTNLGVAYYQAGKWNECIPAFEKSITLSPSFFAYNNLAVVYLITRRYPDAIRAAQKAVEMNPNEYVAKANLADAYRSSGQKDQALPIYDAAIILAFKAFQVNPRDAGALGSLALFYARKGDWENSFDFMRRARSIDPKNVLLAYKAAVVSALADKQDEALQRLKEALGKGYSSKQIEASPDFDKLRSRPEFQKLLSGASRKPN
jgi:tetratricopeptide (TPR) repeat protein